MSESAAALSDDTRTSKSPTGSGAEPASPRIPARAGSTSRLNPRSCITCRRRKVRCDKKNPCSNCTKQGIECMFPGPGRAPRKARNPPETELLSRLRKLEGVMKSLGAKMDEDGSITQAPRAMSGIQEQLEQYSGGESPGAKESNSKRSSVDKQLGRLVINEGRSRYVSNSFWTRWGDEIAEMRDILDAPSSEDDEDYPSPEQSAAGVPSPKSHQGFIFGYSSMIVNLKQLHPSPSQIFILWEVFKENVDPLVRILHRPTAKNVLLNASSNIDNISKSAEALLFAIYFGAVVSLEENQCRSLLGETKETMVNRYRFATEQALARAGFLNSSSLMVLQAFVFFLICVRHQDDSRLVWALGGLAIHLAQSLGIHRDGTNFDLLPFETEMRRRLWWHISILDNRASEDHGTDPTFSEQFYDTKLPLNVNDDDIYPEMKEWPREREGCTEMTFCLIRFELSVTSRRLNFIPPGRDPCQSRQKTLEAKEKIIDDCHKRVEERYLKYCDMNSPIFWVSATVGRLVLAKMWLMAHHPLSYTKDGEEAPSQEVKDRLFITSVEVIEFSYLLETNENTAKWGWLFRTYMQWHAVAFVLSELCVRPPGPEYDRAWRAVESVYSDRPVSTPKSQRGMLWKPIRQLMARAKAHRAKQMTGSTWSSVGADGYQITGTLGAAQSSERSLKNPYVLSTVQSTAEALGLDFENDPGMIDSGVIDLPLNMVGQSQDVAMPESSMTDEDIRQWLASESLVQPTPDFLKWSGWNPGVGNFDIGAPPLNEFAVNGTQQEWF